MLCECVSRFGCTNVCVKSNVEIWRHGPATYGAAHAAVPSRLLCIYSNYVTSRLHWLPLLRGANRDRTNSRGPYRDERACAQKHLCQKQPIAWPFLRRLSTRSRLCCFYNLKYDISVRKKRNTIAFESNMKSYGKLSRPILCVLRTRFERCCDRCFCNECVLWDVKNVLVLYVVSTELNTRMQ